MMQETTNHRLPNRWLLAAGGVLMQLALGAVYAWSVFRDPLIKNFGWSISEVTLTFSIAILVLGFAAFLGGLWMSRVGPRAPWGSLPVFATVLVWRWLAFRLAGSGSSTLATVC